MVLQIAKLFRKQLQPEKTSQREKDAVVLFYWDRSECYAEPVEKENRSIQPITGFAQIVETNLKYDL